jgi:heparanase 1
MGEAGHSLHCRQALVGGNYGLLNTTTHLPHPDFFSAVLFQRLGGAPIPSMVQGPGKAQTRAFAFCSASAGEANHRLTFLILNFDAAATVSVSFAPSVSGSYLQYQLTADSLQSDQVYLNGQLLPQQADLPLDPVTYGPETSVSLPPHSVTWVVFPQETCNGPPPTSTRL